LYVGGRFKFAGGKPASDYAIWNLPQALQIRQTAERVVISWAEAAADYVLEVAASVDAVSWHTAPDEPVLVGREYTVTNSPLDSRAFYRLRHR